jgi:[ribosomal protein S5]-alanine N-acetyltransferase
MKTFPVLETERLILRRITAEDEADVFAILSNPEVTRYYDLDTFTERTQARELIQRHQFQFEKEAGIRWGITRKGSPRLIGSGGLGWQRWNFSTILGYELAQEFWRQGIMTEAIRAMIGYAFTEMKMNRTQATTEMENAASMRVLQKVGFQEEGVLREWGFWKGSFRDVRCFSLLRRDWGSQEQK